MARRDDFNVGFLRAWGVVAMIGTLLLIATAFAAVSEWIAPTSPEALFRQSVLRDPETGCHYVKTWTAITPRLSKEGTPLCD